MKGLFDSDILIDFLKGQEKASATFDRYDELYISRITWIEVLVGAPDSNQETAWKRFMGRFKMVELDTTVAQISIEIRKAHRIKLPDAIIWASARISHGTLVTRNSKDFPHHPEIHIPYMLP
jgi:predicted nucleic acid-binding protein